MIINYFINIRNYYSQDTIKIIKRQTADRVIIFSKHIPKKEFLPKLYKDYLYINKKKRLVNRKMAKNLIGHFTKSINIVHHIGHQYGQ